MLKTVALKSMLAAAALGLATVANAQATPHTPQIKYDPSAEAPPAPTGLNLACTKVPDDGFQQSSTCPVIYYDGYKTWIFSFNDNRYAFALVTYDSTGKLVQNITKNGARYVFDALSDDKGQMITIIGQSKQFVTVNWSELPH